MFKYSVYFRLSAVYIKTLFDNSLTYLITFLLIEVKIICCLVSSYVDCSRSKFRVPPHFNVVVCITDLFEAVRLLILFSAICNIYISRLCYDVSVRLSVTEVHWHIIANSGFKFQSQFTAHCGRSACGCEHWTIYSSMCAREGIIAGKSGGIISRYASHC